MHRAQLTGAFLFTWLRCGGVRAFSLLPNHIFLSLYCAHIPCVYRIMRKLIFITNYELFQFSAFTREIHLHRNHCNMNEYESSSCNFDSFQPADPAYPANGANIVVHAVYCVICVFGCVCCRSKIGFAHWPNRRLKHNNNDLPSKRTNGKKNPFACNSYSYNLYWPFESERSAALRCKSDSKFGDDKLLFPTSNRNDLVFCTSRRLYYDIIRILHAFFCRRPRTPSNTFTL